jgi:aspartate/methionine/tyrosine aminotransferase
MREDPFSRRSAFVEDRAGFSRALEAARVAGTVAFDLTVSNPTRVGLEARGPLDALSAEPVRSYGAEPLGTESARRAVAEELDVPWTRVVLAASSSESYSWLFRLLADPGGVVLSPRPGYPLIDVIAQLDGLRVVDYPLRYADGWLADLGPPSSLSEAPDSKVAVVCAVSPHNPTGLWMSTELQHRLQSFGAPLVVDEVFEAYPIAGLRRTAFTTEGPLHFVLGGLSKRCGLPQMKLGWILVGGDAPCADEALRRLAHIADAFLSVSTPVQQALPQLFDVGTTTRQRLTRRLRENVDAAARILSKSAAEPLPVGGGWSLLIRMPASETDEHWAERVLARGVAVWPGRTFDVPGTHLVASLITPPGVFREGLERLRETLC